MLAALASTLTLEVLLVPFEAAAAAGDGDGRWSTAAGGLFLASSALATVADTVLRALAMNSSTFGSFRSGLSDSLGKDEKIVQQVFSKMTGNPYWKVRNRFHKT